MADLSWSQTLSVSLLTAAITLAGTTYQQARQEERADNVRFLDGAQATAQETSRLLDNGYLALAKLVKGMDKKGWEEYSRGPWEEYMEFHRSWRQQLIAQHFKLSRYFGKDMANDLVHIDEIDIHPVDNLSSPNPCKVPGNEDSFDIEKLANQIECFARFTTIEQGILNDEIKNKKTNDLFDMMDSIFKTKNSTWELLRHYDKSSVSYLRRLDARLTELGVSKVTVIPRSDHND